MTFSPIAIVGQGCLYPNIYHPDDLWNGITAGRCFLLDDPFDEDSASLLRRDYQAMNLGVTNRGGVIRGFERHFISSEYQLSTEEIEALDPFVQWLLYAGRMALMDAGLFPGNERIRGGAVFGNLLLPSRAFASYAESVVYDIHQESASPLHYFMSGLPAQHLAAGLGLTEGAFALDAACASSFYAIKLACDKLHDGAANFMLAGAVNGADPLFLQKGFYAIKALSPTGQSRPFHRQADGLVPVQGAGFVVLRRLEDAIAAGNRIYAVIRGIGLSNDGGRRGMFAPDEDGQVAAMTEAYRISGLTPNRVTLVECHATGTPLGDATEIQSMQRIFGSRVDELTIGSIKSNLGHALTASGMAGLLKIMRAFTHKTLPPSLHTDQPIPALSGSPFRLLAKPEAWPETALPRVAALNSFGFGGTNAHVLLEEYRPQDYAEQATIRTDSSVHQSLQEDVAIVAIGATVGPYADVHAFAEAVFGGATGRRNEEIVLELAGLRFPPNDLARALPQQLVLLQAAREAMLQVGPVSAERTGVFAGVQCDPETVRQLSRIHALDWLGTEADNVDSAGVELWRNAITPLADMAVISGLLTNLAANRLNFNFKLKGPGLVFSDEEWSGVTALLTAARALRAGEIDAALVGATDLCDEPIYASAKQSQVGDSGTAGGDGAVAIVLKRLKDARRDGNEVYAILCGESNETPGLVFGEETGSVDLSRRFGRAHAASGLIHVAAAALSVYYRLLPAENDSQDSIGNRKYLDNSVRLVEVRRPPGMYEKIESVYLRADDHSMDTSRELNRGTITTGVPVIRVPAHRPYPARPQQEVPPAPKLPMVTKIFTKMATGQEPRGTDAVRKTSGSKDWMRRITEQVTQVYGKGVKYQSNTYRILLDRQSAMLRRATAIVHAYPSERKEPMRPVGLGAKEASRGQQSPFSNRPTGVKLNRHHLQHLARATVSDVFGPAFLEIDKYEVIVRMPEPPLLLADRVLGIEGEPGTMGCGTIWTETDVTDDAWYLHEGVMPFGLMIESGQADLLLVSWLGADFLNKGTRVYRLLGGELTIHGRLPVPGDTLSFEITIDGHTQQGEIRIFYFHYDCFVGGELRLSLRGGQAGFFSRQELKSAAGVLWDPAKAVCDQTRPIHPPAVFGLYDRFDENRVKAFAAGRVSDCFGAGFERADTHRQTPCIQGGRMLLFDEVTMFSTAGGPWGRGYLQAARRISGDEWFFDCHFKNDPVMPGTLMLEGCFQAMAFYLAASGYTLDRDCWRFEPVPFQGYKILCRGQVTPDSKRLKYEIFLEEISIENGVPALFADVLVSVDGIKAFHCRRLGVRLVPPPNVGLED